MDKMDEESRPPAAVSAMAMVWLREWSSEVTSFRVLRSAGGGKWAEASEEEELILAFVRRCLELKFRANDSVLVVNSWDMRRESSCLSEPKD